MPAIASSKPATGLAAAHAAASSPARSARPRTSASAAASARLTPRANARRPIHTSAAAASANSAAPQRLEGPYTACARRANRAAEASAHRHAVSLRPISAATGGNNRL